MNSRSLLKMSKFKQSLLFYGLSIVLMKGLSLFMLPFIARYLTPDQMGRLELLTTAAMLMSLFVAMGLEDCLFRFAGVINGKARQAVVASLYSWGLVFGAVAFAIGYYLAPLVSDATHGQIEAYQLQIIWAGVAMEGAICLPLAHLRMHDRAGCFFSIVIARTFFQAALTLILLNHNPHIDSVIIASITATISQALLLAVIQLRATGVAPRRLELRAIWHYGLPLLGSGLCMFALNGVDRIAIAQWCSLSTLGLYGIAAKFSLATVLLMQPFGMWWRPRRFDWLNTNKQQCARVLAIATLILAGVSCLVICAAPILILLLMPPTYHASAFLVSPIVIMFALREASEIHNIGLLSQQSTVPILKINVTSAIIGTLACLLGTYWWGVFGCISGLIVAQLYRLIALYLGGRRSVPTQRYNMLFLLAAGLIVAMGCTAAAIVNSGLGIVHSTVLLISTAIVGILCAVAVNFNYRLMTGTSLSLCGGSAPIRGAA